MTQEVVKRTDAKMAILARLDVAREALAKASDLPEVAEIRDQAETLRVYLAKRGAELEIQNDVAEFRIEAERKLGLMLEAGTKTGRPKKRSHDVTVFPTLQELGIAKNDSSRWQLLAKYLTADEFQSLAKQWREKGKELTTQLFLKVAKQRARDEKNAQLRGSEGSQEDDEDLVGLEDLEEAGEFRCLLMDPPWTYRDSGIDPDGNPTGLIGAAAQHYPTMTVDQIAALPIPKLAHPEGCHLWMWITWPMIRDGVAHDLLDRWGFEWSSELVWKKNGGLGRWLIVTTEVLILATKKGKDGRHLPRTATDGILGFVEAKRRAHSQKPEETYELIERFTPGPRLELFARDKREGWSRWGLEAS